MTYLSSLRLSNYRCFNRAHIDFKPITIFTGSNSSGKSSLLYSMLCALQTKEPNQYPFSIAPNGSYCNLGSYKEMVNGKKIDKKISLGFDLISKWKDNEEKLSIEATYLFDNKTKVILLDKLHTKGVALEMSAVLKDKFCTLKIKKELIGSGDDLDDLFKKLIPVINESLIKSASKMESKSKKKVKVSIKKKKKDIEKYLLSDKDFKGSKTFKFKCNELTQNIIMDKVRGLGFNATNILSVNFTMFTSLRDWMNFIGPARLYPDRIISDTSSSYSKVGRMGENYIALLYAWKAEKSDKYNRVANRMRKLNLTSTILPKRQNEGLLQLMVKIDKKSPYVNIYDAGYGLSQILPIIVADVDLNNGGTLLISQPELHLHPSCQADLADYFNSVFSAQDRRYVIETHSEYMINRFKILVAQGKLDKDDIVIYHMKPSKNHFEPVRVTINKDGTLNNAPKDFFNTYVEDTFNLAMSIENE